MLHPNVSLSMNIYLIVDFREFALSLVVWRGRRGMRLLPHLRNFGDDCSSREMLEWRWNSSPDARWNRWSTGLRVSGVTPSSR
jgi:hypothetical protein